MENEKDKLKPPVPYARFKQLVDKIRELKAENQVLRTQVQLLEQTLKERPRSE